MGFSDIAPLPTTCLKRGRPEEPPELLCPNPPKQPFCSAHNLAILQDLENSLDDPPAADISGAPEALVTEMMQSLEKVMSNIADFMAASNCAPASPLRIESSPSAASFGVLPQAGMVGMLDSISSSAGDAAAPASCKLGEFSEFAPADSLQEETLRCAEEGAGCAAADVAALRGDAEAARENGQSSPEPVTVTAEYGFAYVNYNSEDESSCPRLDHGLPDIRNMPGDAAAGNDHAEQGMLGASYSEMKTPSEKVDGGWSMLDEFADNVSASMVPFARNVWLEDEGDILALNCSQAEEEACLPDAREYSGFLLLDCFL